MIQISILETVKGFWVGLKLGNGAEWSGEMDEASWSEWAGWAKRSVFMLYDYGWGVIGHWWKGCSKMLTFWPGNNGHWRTTCPRVRSKRQTSNGSRPEDGVRASARLQSHRLNWKQGNLIIKSGQDQNCQDGVVSHQRVW